MSETDWVWFGLGIMAGAMLTGLILWVLLTWYLSRERPF